jgi:uncharacterized repeat protein (TIGR03803 family)
MSIRNEGRLTAGRDRSPFPLCWVASSGGRRGQMPQSGAKRCRPSHVVAGYTTNGKGEAKIMMRLKAPVGIWSDVSLRLARRSIILCAFVVWASGCGGGQTQPPTYTIGGSISGLTVSGLILANGGQTVSAAANATSFTFPTQWASGQNYSVTVQAQPTGATCTVSSGTGTVGSADVIGIAVICVNTYTVGGSISGLTVDGLVLSDGSQTVSPAANATSFVFPTPAPPNTVYNIEIQAQPSGKTCLVSQGSGSVGSANVTNIVVTCALGAVLYSFGKLPDGAQPTTGVIQGSDGNFYGTTSSGGATSAACTVGCGTVFMLTPAGVETVLHSFTGLGGDGARPSGLIQGSDGKFYGTTIAGGASANCADSGGCGTVFEMTPAGVTTVLHAFTGTGGDGRGPYGGVIQGSDGSFYGTTNSGGANVSSTSPAGCGTVFKITSTGVETVLYSFNCSAGDGEQPQAGLIQGSDGNFYGTTYQGGSGSGGTVFGITPAGVEKLLYSFQNDGNCGGDNLHPNTSLVEGNDGSFYGTTSGTVGSFYPKCNVGTVFRVTPAGVGTVLYVFQGSSVVATNPMGGLIKGSDGNFYGTTFILPSVFEITPAGVVTEIYAFQNGANPDGHLIQTSDGALYGTFQNGYSANGGAFKVSNWR